MALYWLLECWTKLAIVWWESSEIPERVIEIAILHGEAHVQRLGVTGFIMTAGRKGDA